MEGRITEATEDGIVLETEKGKGKKKEIKKESLLFSGIKTTKILAKF
jgi:ribosome maturation factor RimP